ncbi:ran-binding protein 9 [Lingula anatina]|uniref:Ran-binding protein 9 n=1 Tax=Lingula anatina TaxID=7574 RepID=A0A1S3HSP8_LINAN|nr:ran-binding protein 9 [Lingula anatina]|eukprot:XP_013389065.1 ran-binding protein 9 [Lingula anatina]
MATKGAPVPGDGSNITPQQLTDRLKVLYPAVNEDETPLPRSWSPKDKYNFIGLSQNNLRVHYKGVGKTHKDAASVRAMHPIPASCGIYYFEVKIISKGRDGYMGIGLSAQGVNMNRLPGWDKHSYGYHGDDGHSFCSSGNGQPYGPTFTTGDVVGCCINLIDNTCFYTKNGVNLGVAFTDLPGNLYPTVGLQTPGEVVEANFGQSPFVFDIEDYMKEWRLKTRTTIERFPVPDRRGEFQTALQKIVSTYLVHHGYCATAESFARNTGQAFEEELVSIKNRQRIQKLVLAGRMGEAIDTTQQLYPGLLESHSNLLFMLKCRQFIEMVNGTDSEVRGAAIRSPKSRHSSGSGKSSPNMSPVHHSSFHGGQRSASNSSGNNSPNRITIATKGSLSQQQQQQQQQQSTHNNVTLIDPMGLPLQTISESDMNHMNSMNGNAACTTTTTAAAATNRLIDNDVEMGSLEEEYHSSHSNGVSNGVSHTNGVSREELECDMDTSEFPHQQKRQLCGGNQAAIEKMLQYGRELHAMSVQLRNEYGKNQANKKALQDAFSLLAYSDPWNSPVGFQLDPVQREPVCAALNSAILESHGLPKTPPLQLIIGQATECMKMMAKVGAGSCAFASVTDYLH